jgi:ABC-type transport system involved in multi-copper enzyme maturation permease subunit
MLLGPVFRAELVRAPRRRRYYGLRVIYGVALIFLIWTNYQNLNTKAESAGGELSIDDFSDFALSTFTAFGSVQLGTILMLIPALFGGVIADEKQRKTMHYLMASRLSSSEIVLDKFAAKLLHVGSYILLGLPIMSLLTLFGGVAWDYVGAAYVATFSTTFFAASLAILVSTFARRVRQGVVIAYIIITAWLIVPPLADGVCEWLYPNFYLWFEPVNEWLEITGPLGLMTVTRRYTARALAAPATTFPTFFETYCWMVGLQVGAAIIFLRIAAWQLRPVFRRQEESQPRLAWLNVGTRRPRWLNRPECVSDAMLWKEKYFTRTDVFTKLALLPATIILTVYVILGARFDETVIASFSQAWTRGYAAINRSAVELHDSLISISPLYLAIWMLAAAGAAASSIAFERERGTWDSLIATPLSGWQIVRGKSLGALWGMRGFGVFLGLFWIVGLAAGAIHPFGLLASLIGVAILTWFVIALGMHVSLACKKTSHALTATIAILMGLNIGYLAVLYPVLVLWGNVDEYRHFFIGVTPWVASSALMSYPQVAQLFETLQHPDWPVGFELEALGYGALVFLGYGLVAIVLTWRTVRYFDNAINRPRRARTQLTNVAADVFTRCALTHRPT